MYKRQDYKGIWFEENNEAAAELFAKAAQQGYPRAQVLMGECFENGYGVEKDIDKALELYRAAYDQGYPDGACHP